MFDRQPDRTDASSHSAAQAGSVPAERVMRIAPLDLRQQRFRTAAARVRQDRSRRVPDRGGRRLRARAARNRSAPPGPAAAWRRCSSSTASARTNLRNTLLTAQRLADEVKTAAQNEAKMIVREAQGRADLLLQKAQARLEEIERDINELRLRRRDVEGSLESSIQALYHALEFIREQDKPDEKVLLHRPRGRGPGAAAPGRRAADRRRARLSARPAAIPARAHSSRCDAPGSRRAARRTHRHRRYPRRRAARPARRRARRRRRQRRARRLARRAVRLPRRDIVILSGHASRDKRIAIAGTDRSRRRRPPRRYTPDRRDRPRRLHRRSCAPADRLRRAGAAARRRAGARSTSIADGAVASLDGRIVYAGPPRDLAAATRADPRRPVDRRARHARSFPASSTRTRTRSSPAIGARNCDAGWPAPPTRRSPPRAAASSSTVAATRDGVGSGARRRDAHAARRDARVRHDDVRNQERLRPDASSPS